MRDFLDLVWKELMHLRRSWRLGLLAAFMIVLVPPVVYQSIRWLEHEVQRNRAVVEQNRRQLEESLSWVQVREWGLYLTVPVDPLWVYGRGYWGRWGNMAHVDGKGRLRWISRQWAYEQWASSIEPLDYLDLMAILFAALAILFTYDAISGERERGTWMLLLGTPVSRITILAAKWVGRMLPVWVAAGLTWAAILVGVPVTLKQALTAHWILGSLMVLAIGLVFLGGVGLWGMAASVFARSSAGSLILASLFWVCITWLWPRSAATFAQMFYRPADSGTLNLSIALLEKQIERRYWQVRAEKLGEEQPPPQTAAGLIFESPLLTPEWLQIEAEVYQQIRELQQEAERQTLRYQQVLRLLLLLSPSEDFRAVLQHWIGTHWQDFLQHHRQASDYARRFGEWILELRRKAGAGYTVYLTRTDPFQESRPRLEGMPKLVQAETGWGQRILDVWPEWLAWFLFHWGLAGLTVGRFLRDRPKA